MYQVRILAAHDTNNRWYTTEMERVMSNYYDPMDHTAEEWRAMAKKSAQSEQESWERSDTDGFLSQWALQASGRMYRDLADLRENNGVHTFAWPYLVEYPDGPDGPKAYVSVEDWAWIDGRYGASVLIKTRRSVSHLRVKVRTDRDGVNSFFWNPSEARKGATRLHSDERKGVVWGWLDAEAFMRFSKGLNPIPVPYYKTDGKRSNPVAPKEYMDYE